MIIIKHNNQKSHDAPASVFITPTHDRHTVVYYTDNIAPVLCTTKTRQLWTITPLHCYSQAFTPLCMLGEAQL